MRVESAQEALFIACEMERGAVQLYERALFVMEDLGRQTEPLYENLRRMLSDEKRHLVQFQSLYEGLEEPLERRLTLSAVAGGLLFDGGLMGAARAGLLTTVDSMLRYAEGQEARAAENYRDFAAQTQDPGAKAVLLSIAAEEGRHLDELHQRVRL